MSPSSAEPGSFQARRVVGFRFQQVAACSYPVPLTCPRQAPSPPGTFSSQSPGKPSRAACRGGDSFQLMSSPRFKALITLKESLFPRCKRKVHKLRAVDYKALPRCPQLLTPAHTCGPSPCLLVHVVARFLEQRFGEWDKGGSEGPRSASQQDPPCASRGLCMALSLEPISA